MPYSARKLKVAILRTGHFVVRYSMYRKRDFMILLKITEIKNAMAQFLIHEGFDDFYMEQADVITYAKLTLQGKRNPDWYDEKPESDWMYWREIKPIVFSYIRGERTPTAMRISLKASESAGQRLMQNSRVLAQYQAQKPDLNLQLRYKNDELEVVTGITQREFSLDKQLEFAWDEAVTQYFKELGIAFL